MCESNGYGGDVFSLSEVTWLVKWSETGSEMKWVSEVKWSEVKWFTVKILWIKWSEMKWFTVKVL